MDESSTAATAESQAEDVSGQGAGGIVWRRRLFVSRRVALVRRTRHADTLGADEWSLPKGHRRESEDWMHAALREVEEETGWRCVPLADAGSIRYPTTTEGSKEVRFWTMRALCRVGRPAQDGEVVELAWLSSRKALCRLTYPDQARLLASAGVGAGVTGTHMGWLRLGGFGAGRSRRNRLSASIRVFRAELEERKAETEQREPSAVLHLTLAIELLDDAHDLLGRGDLNGGWHAFFGARYHETLALDEAELQLRADALSEEAAKKVKDSWRGPAVRRLLDGVVAVGSERPSRETSLAELRRRVAEAQRLLDDRAGNVYRRLDHLRDQLALIGLVALPAFVALIALLATGIVPISGTSSDFDKSGVIYGVFLFGMLGGAFSGALSLVQAPIERSIPEVLSSGLTTVLVRPLIGAVAALAAYAFLRAGVISVDAYGAAYAVAFAAGFSERLVTRAAESIAA
jgi:8-oxo-dGTP diphosphatase